jgi:thioredoxin reductase
MLSLKTGEAIHMGFLVHKPITMLVAEDLVNDLGIETEQSPTAKNIKRQGTWNTTDVKGVYAAGDAVTPISNIVTAMAHGMIWSLIGIMGLN